MDNHVSIDEVFLSSQIVYYWDINDIIQVGEEENLSILNIQEGYHRTKQITKTPIVFYYLYLLLPTKIFLGMQDSVITLSSLTCASCRAHREFYQLSKMFTKSFVQIL